MYAEDGDNGDDLESEPGSTEVYDLRSHNEEGDGDPFKMPLEEFDVGVVHERTANCEKTHKRSMMSF